MLQFHEAMQNVSFQFIEMEQFSMFVFWRKRAK